MLFEIRVVKVHIRHSGWILKLPWLVGAVFDRACRETLELHNVLGQRASLITEDVMDHAKLFIQVR